MIKLEYIKQSTTPQGVSVKRGKVLIYFLALFFVWYFFFHNSLKTFIIRQLDGKAGKTMEQNNIDTTKAGNQGQPAQEEKTFTQEEVNRIVQERLARSKGNQEQPKGGESSTNTQDKETELKERELNLLAREKLLEADLGVKNNNDCLPLFAGCVDEKDLDSRIEVLKSIIAENRTKPLNIKGLTPGPSAPIPTIADANSDKAIRDAMGL